MTYSKLDFAALTPVNYLWPDFVEHLGVEKAQQAVRQARDLQVMRGDFDTLPVLFVETCGLALVSTRLVRDQIGIKVPAERMVMLLSTPKQALQLLKHI